MGVLHPVNVDPVFHKSAVRSDVKIEALNIVGEPARATDCRLASADEFLVQYL